ncbi:hypothetical protein VTK26DRAFT_2425 [Humicola hyalothermophila]
MHQQSRHPPRVASPASSPQTNPARTNNPRDRARAAESDIAGRDSSAGSDGSERSNRGPSRESVKKLDQIIQNFYYKAAVLILQSRLNTTPSGGRKEDERKSNRWFSIDTDDIEDFRDELRIYRTCGSFENRPPPMIIETYIDASGLSNSQSLVVIDENGKRWDVLEALNSSETLDDSPRRRHSHQRNTEVVLERWRVELKCLPNVDQDEFGPTLPTIYKRGIVFFRSLFMTTRIMPCWKYSQQALAKGIHPALEVKCRILDAEPEYTSYDPLRLPLHDGRDPVTEYVFTDLEVPVGRIYSSVTYRNDCNFRVDDAESLLSSRFLGVDENLFKPSIPSRREQGHGRSDSYAEPGSLPSQRRGRDTEELQQTYGSLSTFHGAGAPGTSPITALRSVRPLGSDTSSPSGSASTSVGQSDPPHSMPIRGAASRPRVRTFEGSSRRPSVSFQPFKAGSLSGSPRLPDAEAPASPPSLTRPGLSGPSRTGNRSSLTAGMPASLRGPSSAAPQDIPPVTGSPRPTSRYSSSFTHRRGRPSFGGQSKGDDDQGSSGKQSLSSSAQPGSGLLAEAGGVASSGSFATDDDNISEFLKALDSRKTLKSFEPNRKGESVASKKTAAQLTKFHLMRESNNALTDSMTSSVHLQRSSISSSRQLANVPGMVNPASLSASSSPGGKPLSPHTPHTPAIPSRLSENSIIDYQAPGAQTTRRHRPGTPDIDTGAQKGAGRNDDEDDEDDGETPMTTQQDTQRLASTTTATSNSAATTTTGTPGGATSTTTRTAAIDIPLSPRLLHVTGGGGGGGAGSGGGGGVAAAGVGGDRRASSAALHRSIADEAAGGGGGRAGLYHRRSASFEDALARDEQPPATPSLGGLLGRYRRSGLRYHESGNGSGSGREGGADGGEGEGVRTGAEVGGPMGAPGHQPPPRTGTPGGEGGGGAGGSSGSSRVGGGLTNRFASTSGRGAHHRMRSFSSATGRYGPSGMDPMIGGGGGGVGAGADEEPLLFTMSELERDVVSRRSLEEAPRAGSSGPPGSGRNGGEGGAEEDAGAGAAKGGSGSASGRRSEEKEFEPRGILRKGW